jgi:PEP-CTERM motif
LLFLTLLAQPIAISNWLRRCHVGKFMRRCGRGLAGRRVSLDAADKGVFVISSKALLVASVTILAGVLPFSPLRANADVLYTYTGQYGDFTYLSPSFTDDEKISLGALQTSSLDSDIIFLSFFSNPTASTVSFFTLPCINDACETVDFAPDAFLNVGSYTSIFGTGGGDSTLIVSEVSPGVPEPSTWAMMGVGFAGLGFLARRRKIGAAIAG